MQEPDKLSAYYNNSSKRSFFFYRLSIGATMLLLMVVLTVNLYVINSNQPTNVRSQAATNQSTTVALPELPEGCAYIASGKGYSVSCEKLINAKNASPSVTPSPVPANGTPQTNPTASAAATR